MQPIISNPYSPSSQGLGTVDGPRGERESCVGNWSEDRTETGCDRMQPLDLPASATNAARTASAPTSHPACPPPQGSSTAAPSDATSCEEARSRSAATSRALVSPHAPPPTGMRDLTCLTVIDDAPPAPAHLPGPEATPEAAHKLHGFARVGVMVGLALTGLGILQGVAPQAAFAATPQTSMSQTIQRQAETRIQAPVHVTSVQDAVNRFDAQHQLYVKGTPQLSGRPLSAEEMKHFQDVLKDHPSTYVVLIDASTDFKGDDMTLSRGIGASAAFRTVVNPQTGEGNGKLFMIYFNVDNNPANRKFAYRAAELPDRLGVGEQNFADPNTGAPRELLGIFINSFKNEGKDVPGALEDVMKRVDAVESEHVQKTVGSADQAVKGAQAAYDGFATQLRTFQGKHGRGGELGSPEVETWRSKLSQAKDAFNKRDFATATRLSNELTQTLRAQELAMANYGEAPTVAAELQAQLDKIGPQLKDLENNRDAETAREAYANAQRQLEQYNTEYKAKDASFWDTLRSAGESTEAATKGVQASKDAAASAHKWKMIGVATVTVSLLATAFLMNRRAREGRKKAELELKEAIHDIGQRSKELMDLMNRSDYHQLKGYEGKTKELADQLMVKVTDALTLVGGAQKFLTQADKMINHGGPKNWLFRRNFDRAIDLLNNREHRLTFDFNDASRAVIEKGSKAEMWRDELQKAGATREFQKSLKEILEAMADNRDSAVQIQAEIEKKDSEISTYLESVQKSATEVRANAEALQKDASDGIFAVPSVTDNLLPMVLSDKDGLVARGIEARKNDPVRAWDDFAEPAKRMSEEAAQIVAVGREARETLLPTLQRGDDALLPHDVKTKWAHDDTDKLSDRLDKAANTSLRTSVASDVQVIGKDVDALELRINTAVDQDKERREVCPGLISDAETDVTAARTELKDKLQSVGAFKAGTPEQVLREKDLDPTTRTRDAHTNLEAVKPALDMGDVDTAGQHLVNVHDMTRDAHRLVKESRDAFDTYAPTLDERQQRTRNIDGSIGSVYQPSLDRIKRGYQEEVLRLVAPEVRAGDTLADNVNEARTRIGEARSFTANAQGNFDRAWLLTSRDELVAADQALKLGQGNLDAITRAESLLAEKQQKVETSLRSLDGDFATTQTNANQSFVRERARQLLASAQSELSRARQIVGGASKNPFRAKEALDVAETQRKQVEGAIEADRKAYNEAVSEIRSAETSVTTATAAISAAAMQSWSWSNRQGSASESVSMSDLMGANSYLASASSSLSQARSYLTSKDYEAAERAAANARQSAGSAVVAAQVAVSSAKTRFDNEVSHLKDLQQQEDDREAERKRQADSGSTNGNMGNGGSGSTSGNW